MTGQEAQHIISMLNAYWRNSPLDDAAARLWAVELLEFDFQKASAAVRRMAKTPGSFPPSLGDLLSAISPPPSAAEAFNKLLSIMLIYSLTPPTPEEHRDNHTPDAMLATVKRLGGWSVVAQMDRTNRMWEGKRWDKAWEEVHAEIAAGRPMAELLPAPRVLPKLQDADRNVFGEIMDRGASSKALAAMLGKGGE